MQEIDLDGIRVSLAGPTEVHDRLRRPAAGSKTCDRWESLSLILEAHLRARAAQALASASEVEPRANTA